MTTYPTRNDLNLVFGKANIDRWADPENASEDPSWTTERINWACQMASINFEGRLADGPYTIPIPDDGGTPIAYYPPMVVMITACMAGVMLYDTRRVADSESEDQVAAQRKNYKTWIRQILRGQLKLTYSDGTAVEKTAWNAPFVGYESED